MQLDDRKLYKNDSNWNDEKNARSTAPSWRKDGSRATLGLHEEKMKAIDKAHKEKMAEYQKQAKAEVEERALRVQKLQTTLDSGCCYRPLWRQ